MNKDVGTCPFPYDSNLPKCINLEINSYYNLLNFFLDKPNGVQNLIIATTLQCIENKKNHIVINEKKCIRCLFCVFACPDNLIEIRENLEVLAKCSNYNSNYGNILSHNFYNSFFKGNLIALPVLDISHFNVRFRSLEDFTEIDEIKNLSMWAANLIKYLSFSKRARIGKEINMMISKRARGGRLDICLLSDDHLMVFESKVNFTKMMSEDRYLTQMLAYESEIQNTIRKLERKINYKKILLIDGSETDLMPPNHPYCTSKIGNQSSIFYNNLVRYKLFFISSESLFLLSILKLFKGNEYSLEKIIDKYFNSNIYGLTSAGFIEVDNDLNHSIINIE